MRPENVEFAAEGKMADSQYHCKEEDAAVLNYFSETLLEDVWTIFFFFLFLRLFGRIRIF